MESLRARTGIVRMKGNAKVELIGVVSTPPGRIRGHRSKAKFRVKNSDCSSRGARRYFEQVVEWDVEVMQPELAERVLSVLQEGDRIRLRGRLSKRLGCPAGGNSPAIVVVVDDGSVEIEGSGVERA